MKISSQLMLEKIIRWGLYATAFIPLIVWRNYFSPFHFGKVIVFRTLIEILFVLYVILISTDRRFLPKMNVFLWIVTAFTGIYFLTSLTSVNVYQSFMGTIERMGGFFTFFHFWLYLIMLVLILRTQERWLHFLYISVIAGLVSLVYGFLQKAPVSEYIFASGNRLRILGTLGNPAIFAGYQLMTLFFAGILLLQSSAKN